MYKLTQTISVHRIIGTLSTSLLVFVQACEFPIKPSEWKPNYTDLVQHRILVNG